MPQVVAGIIGAIVGVASVVGSIVSVITSVVATILSPIFSVITTVIGGITGFLGPAIGKLMAPLTSLANSLIGPIAGQVNILGSQILGPVIAIQATVSSGILDIQQAATGAFMPILTPVADTLGTIRTYVGSVEDIIVDGLEPVKDMTDVIRSISTIKMSNTLLAGTQDILTVIDPLTRTKFRSITGAITTTWRETVEAVTGLSVVVDDYYKMLAGEIDAVDDRLTQETETALAALTGKVDTSLASLENIFSGETQRIDRQVRTVERRLTDLPWFQQMMIKGLS